LGKISDALEKSNKAKIASANKLERPKVISEASERPKVISEASERPKVIASDRESPNVIVKDRSPKRDIPFDKGDILHADNNIDKKMISFSMPQSYEAEQFKMLKTSILFPASGKPPRSIMITSAVPGEGKSFVTANLAISIAQNIEEHVLIVDCDLRSPCIHKQFGFGSVTGLSEYLSNGAPLDSLFLKTKVNKLSILPGGKSPQNPSELLSSQKMAKLLEEVKNRYGNRYIVIDSPPPRLTAETHVIAKQVDGIILVVKHRDTRREAVEDLVKMIGKEKILGVVLNRSDLRISGYYGYSKYGKYHKYYGKK